MDYKKWTLVVCRGNSSAIITTSRQDLLLTQCLVIRLVSRFFDPVWSCRFAKRRYWTAFNRHHRTLLGWLPPAKQVKRGSRLFLVWSADLPKLENIKISWSFLLDPFFNLDLHIFGDNFQYIFKAVAFLRARITISTGKEKTELAFVMGERRAAPVKIRIVPKLELPAALHGARLKREMIGQLH